MWSNLRKSFLHIEFEILNFQIRNFPSRKLKIMTLFAQIFQGTWAFTNRKKPRAPGVFSLIRKVCREICKLTILDLLHDPIHCRLFGQKRNPFQDPEKIANPDAPAKIRKVTRNPILTSLLEKQSWLKKVWRTDIILLLKLEIASPNRRLPHLWIQNR